MSRHTIVIDAGHGGHDPGALYDPDGPGPLPAIEEADVALEVALELGMLLEHAGCDVILTRLDDTFLSLSQRAAVSNVAGADAFVSVHVNAATTPKAEGIETFHFPGSRRGEALASAIQGALVRAFCPPAGDHVSRGVKAAGFVVLRETQAPAALVECEFVSNPKRAAELATPEKQRAFARAIAAGVLAWLRVPVRLPDIILPEITVSPR